MQVVSLCNHCPVTHKVVTLQVVTLRVTRPSKSYMKLEAHVVFIEYEKALIGCVDVIVGNFNT